MMVEDVARSMSGASRESQEWFVYITEGPHSAREFEPQQGEGWSGLHTPDRIV